MRMTFSVNTSPFAGKEGKFVTSRNLKDRLQRELERNLALRVEPGTGGESFEVSGRGCGAGMDCCAGRGGMCRSCGARGLAAERGRGGGGQEDIAKPYRKPTPRPSGAEPCTWAS